MFYVLRYSTAVKKVTDTVTVAMDDPEHPQHKIERVLCLNCYCKPITLVVLTEARD